MVISKKMKIIGFSMLGVAITAIAIAVPLSIKKDDNEKSLSTREIFLDLSKKEIILNKNKDIDLKEKQIQDEVIAEIKKRATFLNQKQKDSIKIKTKIGFISYKKSLEIEIFITLNQKEETFIFKFKRAKNNYDHFIELSNTFQTLETKSEDVDLSLKVNQDFIKEYIKKQASFLSLKEKNSIEIITKTGKVSFSNPIEVEIYATFFNIKSKFTFRFTRKETTAEKSKNKKLFDSLKQKMDAIKNLSITLTQTNDLNLSNPTSRNIVKDEIVKRINSIVVNNVLPLEKGGIFITSQGIITHTIILDIDVKIIFGSSNQHNYTFKLSRTKSQIEIDKDEVAKIKTKIKKTNLTINKNVDTSDDAKILAAIKVQLKIDNPTLSNDDLDKITDNISSLTPGVNTNVTLTITANSENDTINITINRPPKAGQEIIDSIKRKLSKVNFSKTHIINSNQNLNKNDKSKIKQFIFDQIDKVNPKNILSNEEKKIFLFDKNFISYVNINPNKTSTVPFVFTSGLKSTGYKDFLVKRKKNQNDINFENLKSKINNINSTQTLSDKNNLDLSNNQVQTKIKNFIFDKIDAANISNELSQLEKQAISLLTTSGTITHTNTIDVNVKIVFGSNTKTYTFKLARTKSNDEIHLSNLESLKAKFDRIKKSIRFSDTSNINISTSQTKIKNKIIEVIEQKISSRLSQNEKDAIIVDTKSGLIDDETSKNINIKIKYGNQETLVAFNFLRTPSTDARIITLLKQKVEKAKTKYNKNKIILDSETFKRNSGPTFSFWNSSSLPPSAKAEDIAGANMIKNNIFEAIKKSNSDFELLEKEKNYINLIEDRIHRSWDVNFIINIKISNEAKEYSFNFLAKSISNSRTFKNIKA